MSFKMAISMSVNTEDTNLTDLGHILLCRIAQCSDNNK